MVEVERSFVLVLVVWMHAEAVLLLARMVQHMIHLTVCDDGSHSFLFCVKCVKFRTLFFFFCVLWMDGDAVFGNGKGAERLIRFICANG